MFEGGFHVLVDLENSVYDSAGMPKSDVLGQKVQI